MPDHLARIRRSFGGGRRRSLYWWFWDHYDEIIAEREPVNGDRKVRIDWETVADSLNEIGIRVLVGKEERLVTGATARRTFHRVEVDRKAQGIRPVTTAVPRRSGVVSSRIRMVGSKPRE